LGRPWSASGTVEAVDLGVMSWLSWAREWSVEIGDGE
jgi:hypothetical protein